MLCQFTFKNFKSYKNETVFDCQAASLPEFHDSLFSTPGSKTDILPLSVIYGPNGGGKSNLLEAMACLISTVVNPIHELKKNRCETVLQQTAHVSSFAFDENSRLLPTEFQIYFRIQDYEYRYYLAIYQDTIRGEDLSRKKVNAKKSAQIFSRDDNDIVLGAMLKKKNINTDVNPKMPFLSFLAINYNIPVIADVQIWFESCIIRNFANYKSELTILYTPNELFKKQVLHLLNDMDIDISDYRIDSERRIYTQRIINNRSFELPLEAESDGTTKLICILPIILLALHEGRLLIMDELDAKLHPKLLRYVISLFRNPKINKHNAQLLFTAHDISIMKNTVFRRDEIWFASENEHHESEIYSLYEIRQENHSRINNTAAYDKQYLEGRYGADPYLRNMLDGSDWQ